jgi:hypothetical protein
MRSATRTCLVIALLTASLLVAGLPLAEAQKVKITIPATAVTFASLYHAKTAGYFAEEGLDVEVVTVEGGKSLQALLARDAEFTVAPGTYQLQAYERGQRVLATASILTRNAINLVMHKDAAREKGISERSPLAEKVAALRGLRVSGVAVGSFSYQVMLSYLLKAGLDPQKDVTLIGVGAGAAMLAALEQRKVDAIATGTPIPDAAVMRGFGVMIVKHGKLAMAGPLKKGRSPRNSMRSTHERVWGADRIFDRKRSTPDGTPLDTVHARRYGTLQSGPAPKKVLFHDLRRRPPHAGGVMGGRHSKPLRSGAQRHGRGGSRAATPGAPTDARHPRGGRPPVHEKTADPRDHATARGLAPHGDRVAHPLRAVRRVRASASTPVRPSEHG